MDAVELNAASNELRGVVLRTMLRWKIVVPVELHLQEKKIQQRSHLLRYFFPI